jgi:hypothetical protein
LRERVQFAYMEFGSENKVVDSRALKILGEVVEVTARVGERRFTEFGRDQSAALDTDFEAVHTSYDGAEGFIGTVKALKEAGMLAIIKASRAKEEMEGAKRAN